MFWAIAKALAGYAKYLVAFQIFRLLTQPKGTTQQMQPGQVDATTNENGQEMPVLFGTDDCSMDVAWYGDKRAVAIRKKGGKK